jgi:methionyl aminopeptidase
VIQLKSPRELEVMAVGGQILGRCLHHAAQHVAPGVTTADLDGVIDAFIRSHDGAVPTFKGQYGFPASACISVNEEIVHGIPSRTRVLRAGDLVTLDAGVTYGGLITDSAVTLAVGAARPEDVPLLEAGRRALDAAIQAAVVGNHIGDIGAAIEQVVTAAGFTTAADLVGHGVGYTLHDEPQVPNFGKPKRGPKLQAGLTIAIEPMVCAGGPATRTLADKWTVVTRDARRSVHFEHTIAVTDGPARVLTMVESEVLV